MKNKINTFFFGLVFLSLFLFYGCKESKQPLELWYKQPADKWMQATPIGNGRLGAMIYGGIETETIALNEITFWSGQPDENQELPCGKEKLAEMRKLFFDGKLKEGNEMAARYLSGKPHSFGTHLPVGDLKFNFSLSGKQISDYKRSLNIENALSTITFKADNINFTREYFCTNPDNIMAARFSADTKASISFNLSLDLLQDVTIDTKDNELSFAGQVSFPKLGPGGVKFHGKIKIQLTGGKIQAEKDQLVVTDADDAIVWIDIHTDYKKPEFKTICEDAIQKITLKKYDQVKQNHIDDYARLFNRVEFSLGENETNKLPTDVRWKSVKEGNIDAGLDALFFQYGRYLLISCSRENSPLAANLQGLWNDNLACNMPWTCDYHLDINTQQNYWAANLSNLHECNLPLFNYIEDLSAHGEKTAMKVYGSPGWVAHTVANVWGYTAPGEGITWGLHTTAGVWIATHLWEHYQYTKDTEFLKNKAYPILKKAAQFFQDYLVEDSQSGYIVTGPSNSPENSFLFDGADLALSMMPTGDMILLTELYTACIESSKILGIDKEFSEQLQKNLEKLPPYKIGKNGGIQEWFEDYEEAHPNHRHTTHLLGFYPFSQITLDKTPELAKAAGQTIKNRLSAEGWEDTEWSRANMVCFYARLKEPEEAYKSIIQLQQDFARENLLTISPPGIAMAEEDIFIFDGNEAGIAGMAEMLLQNHQGYIEFLPALPQAWNTGYFKGLCIKGGAEVDLYWKNGLVQDAQIRATADNTFSLKIPDNTNSLKISKNGDTINPENSNGIITFEMKKGDKLAITY